MMRSLFVLIFLFPLTLLGQLTTESLVHEAFMSQDQSNIVLEAVLLNPPKAVSERIPVNTIENAIWIPGYWAWLGDRYIWMSGTWRVPPPGHEWIAGMWKQFDGGWVWLKGFWSPLGANSLIYLRKPPPDNVDEDVQNPVGEGYFWIPGHWSYSEEKNNFIWFTGRWQEFDANWQYVPARYVWREKGYTFIDGFWDWSLENRGVAYAAVNITQDEADTISYMPEKVAEPKDIMQAYYPYWPDYFITFQYWSFFHSGFDFGWGAVPTWWSWPSWWAFNDVDLWSLWWWWSHPTFPHPFFITEKLSTMILPPEAKLIERMKSVPAKPFITRNGVVDILDLIHAIENYSGHSEPIMPIRREQVFTIQEDAHPTKRPPKLLRPTGEEPPVTIPAKPFSGPSHMDFSQPIERTPAPAYPQGVMKPRVVGTVIPPVVPRARTYETEYVPPPTEEPQVPETLQDPPHLYLQRNNTRVRPPYPESYYRPRSPYAPPVQRYTPQTMESAPPYPESYYRPYAPRYAPRYYEREETDY